MESIDTSWWQLLFRWIHVVAGIAWIGHLYFFNWVNGPFQKAGMPEGNSDEHAPASDPE